MTTPTPEHNHHDNRPGEPVGPVRVLIIEPEAKVRRSLTSLLRDNGFICDPTGRRAEAIGALAGAEYDVAVIGMRQREGSGVEILRDLLERAPAIKAVMIGVEPMLDHAVSALRLGAVDLIARPIDRDDALASVRHAADLARRDRDRDARLRRLERICHVLGRSRADEAAEVDSLCKELEAACSELDAHAGTLRLASEFRAVIDQELDIEKLLRATLEFMLRRTGPTNAAVYLPSNHSDYSLGAYVNYDCPKDTADMLLDHLADTLAPAFADTTGVVVMDDEDELAAHLGADAHWLSGNRVITFACRDADECLAVVTFFRDRDKPFPEDLPQNLDALRDVFAAQLAKVVRVHHRLVPDKGWLGADDADDFGLAA